MEYIKNILINYWPQILAALLFTASFILQLLKKKPIEVVSTIREIIYEKVPEAIKAYEKFYGSGHGADKKKSVIRFVMDEIERCYALTDAQRSLYSYYISNFIEEIMSTPKKHDNK